MGKKKIKALLRRAGKILEEEGFSIIGEPVAHVSPPEEPEIFVDVMPEEPESPPSVAAPAAPEVAPLPPGQEDIMVISELKFGGGEIEEEVRNVPLVFHKLPEDVKGKIGVDWKPPKLDDVDEKYPLIPPHAFAHIHWSTEEGRLLYDVEEPPITSEEREALERIKTLLLDLIDVSSYDLMQRGDASDYISKRFREIVEEYGFKLTPMQVEKLEYYIIRDFTGLEKIEPLMHDPNLEDISCIGPAIPVYVYHRLYGSLKTNIVFETHDELNRFIVKLAQMCGRHVSVASPLLEGALPDGSRVEAMYAITKDISTKGSTFTIRKFSKDPLTITDLMRFGTLPPLIAAYLWLAIEHRQSILVAGGTATGKTTMLNVLSLFIPPGAKVISIEDTPELRLPHEHWIQKIAREGVEEGEKITMFDLLKASLRERPDYIIVGEVRGREAYVLFQGMATGHPGLATIHAEDMHALSDRLTTPPISLPASLLHSLNIVIFMGRSKRGGLEVRRLRELHEVVGVNLKEKIPVTSLFAKWVPSEDSFEFVADRSYVVDRIVETKGVSVESVWAEIKRREKVLKWMKDKNIRYYRDVGRIISRYYQSPESLMEEIENDTQSSL